MTGSGVYQHVYAHSLEGRPIRDWETLSSHSGEVAAGAASRAEAFGHADPAFVSGFLHDIGKASLPFQAYIGAVGAKAGQGRVDHSTAGALEVVRRYGAGWGTLLAFVIAGHHAGLADGPALAERLREAPARIPDASAWVNHLPSPPVLSTLSRSVDEPKGFAAAFLTRMMFSCLVDADFTATDAFYARSRGEVPYQPSFANIPELVARLDRFLDSAKRDDTPVNRLRAEVRTHVAARAADAPGLFTLTVPTGGGKTLTSLEFALRHAAANDLRRIVYVIPFTSIIEQTADVFRGVLGNQDVLEHHATFDWEEAAGGRPATADDTGQGTGGLARLRRAAENWDAPVVVTTGVQFFESLFASRTSRCRKLHNLARSVIVLDEAQTLPLRLLRPCLAALDMLARSYGSTAVLCTATQPAVRRQDGFAGGLDIPADRELAPNPRELYRRLHRVDVVHRAEPVGDAEIADRFAEVEQMLVIVNRRDHAQALFARIGHLAGATHLTTLMCPKHRRAVLADVRARLGGGRPVRLVATSLIEAGVDVSFPEVWRALAGLDSLAQAAGRCNRNDELATLGRRGLLVVFEPADAGSPPQDLRAPQQAAAGVLRRHTDPLSLDAVQDYFKQLYWVKDQKGRDAFDAAKLDGEPFPIMLRIAERSATSMFPFESIARAFRVIDTALDTVVVPWDDDACNILKRIATMDRPLGADLRRLQQYVVPIPREVRTAWLATGDLVEVHASLSTSLLKLNSLTRYNGATGLQLDTSLLRDAELNIVA